MWPMRGSPGENNRPSASDSAMDFRRRLLDLIDRSDLSDRQLSSLRSRSADTVRNLRRGSYPRLDTLEALCRALGGRLEIVPLDERRKPPKGLPVVEKRPARSNRLREEIHEDLVEILGHDDKVDSSTNGTESGCQVRWSGLEVSMKTGRRDRGGHRTSKAHHLLDFSAYTWSGNL